MLLFKFLFYARFVARVMCCIITRTLFEYRAPGGRARPWGPRLLSGPWDFVLSVGLRTRDPGASSQRPPLVGLGPQPGSWLRAGSGVQQGRVGFPVPRPVTSAGRLSAGSGQPSSRPSARASLTRCARLPLSLSSQPGAPGRWGQAGPRAVTWPCRGSSLTSSRGGSLTASGTPGAALGRGAARSARSGRAVCTRIACILCGGVCFTRNLTVFQQKSKGGLPPCPQSSFLRRAGRFRSPRASFRPRLAKARCGSRIPGWEPLRCRGPARGRVPAGTGAPSLPGPSPHGRWSWEPRGSPGSAWACLDPRLLVLWDGV